MSTEQFNSVEGDNVCDGGDDLSMFDDCLAKRLSHLRDWFLSKSLSDDEIKVVNTWIVMALRTYPKLRDKTDDMNNRLNGLYDQWQKEETSLGKCILGLYLCEQWRKAEKIVWYHKGRDEYHAGDIGVEYLSAGQGKYKPLEHTDIGSNSKDIHIAILIVDMILGAIKQYKITTSNISAIYLQDCQIFQDHAKLLEKILDTTTPVIEIGEGAGGGVAAECISVLDMLQYLPGLAADDVTVNEHTLIKIGNLLKDITLRNLSNLFYLKIDKGTVCCALKEYDQLCKNDSGMIKEKQEGAGCLDKLMQCLLYAHNGIHIICEGVGMYSGEYDIALIKQLCGKLCIDRVGMQGEAIGLHA